MLRISPIARLFPTRPPVRAGLRKLAESSVVWQMRAATRRQLRAQCVLDDHLLKDIGLTPGELRCVAMRPFWPASDPAIPPPLRRRPR